MHSFIQLWHLLNWIGQWKKALLGTDQRSQCQSHIILLETGILATKSGT